MITALDIIQKVRTLLNDSTGVRWVDAECLSWLNDAQGEIVKIYPKANVINAAISLSSGTKQSIPIGGIEFIEGVRNVVGGLAGKAITRLNRKTIDETLPTWHTEVAATDGQVDYYIFDDRDPTVFYVYPQSDGVNSLDIVYSAVPTKITATPNAITIPDVYAGSIIDYMLYRAYSKDTDVGDASRASAYYQVFKDGLSMQGQAEGATAPKGVANGIS